MLVIRKSLSECPCYRIKATDTNYFVLLVDPAVDAVAWVTVVEIFEPGGATPPNVHRTPARGARFVRAASRNFPRAISLSSRRGWNTSSRTAGATSCTV